MHTDNPTKTQNQTHHTPSPMPLPGKAFLLKTCRTCGKEKQLRSFYKQRSGRGPYRADCILCVRAENNRNREARRAEKARGERRCRKCRETLPLADFLPDQRRQSGHRPDCRRCEARLDGESDQRPDTLSLPDKLIPRYSELREQRIDLGIAIAHATCPPGECRSREEIAAYTGLTVEAVRRIEVRALWKMRVRARKALEALGLEHFVKEGLPQ